MKKLSKVLLTIMMTLILFTGCSMKEDMGFVIDTNENMSITIIMAMDNEMIDSMISMQNMDSDDGQTIEKDSITDEQRWKYVDSSLSFESDDEDNIGKKEKYEENGMKGYKYTTKSIPMDTISSSSATERIDLGKAFEGSDLSSSKTLFIKNGDKYISNLKYTLNDEIDYSQYKSMGAMFDMNFVIILPNESIKNNADKVENNGKKLSWSLLESKNIELEFTINKNSTNNDNNNNSNNPDNNINNDNNSNISDNNKSNSSSDNNNENNNIILYIVIGVLAGIVAILLLVILTSRKKKDSIVNTDIITNENDNNN